MFSLAIVIVSYNVRDLLARCLAAVYESLAASPDLEAVVWVVDNASADGSAGIVRSRFPQACLLASERNLGFASGNNAALRAMGFTDSTVIVPEYVLLLNPDTEVQADALAQMVRFMKEQPRAGAVTARLQYGDGRFQHSAFRLPSLAQIWFDFFAWPGRLIESRWNGRYPRALYDAGKPFAVECGLGAAFLIRSAAIRQIGLMDEGFFMYGEEMDWCWRLRKGGWQVYCVPGARVVHHEGQSARQFREAMYVALWRSRFRLYR
ncbi:MAG: glycosyltransferase family 2 protein, partial [Anaerolineae bacterium]|nr:glycosyltransferase family 2 protein [Anaerolineae bacterium]